MNFRRLLLASAAILALPAAASAQVGSATPGFYLGLGGGWNKVRDADWNSTNGAVGSSGEMEFSNGWAVIGALGYQMGNGFRVELEPGYRRNSADSTTTNVGDRDADGRLSALSLMTNAIYELPLTFGLRPYLGVGIGGARLSADFSIPNVAGADLSVDDEDWVFAYQGIAGLGFALSDTVTLGIDYRYFKTQDPEFNSNRAGAGGKWEGEYASHTILASLRYSFGSPRPEPMRAAPIATPAPAPVPTPAPAVMRQSQTFLVFFDWDSANLTSAARDTVTTAVNAIRSGGNARIEVVGHTDTSGSPQYNQRLGLRRADAVRAEMTRQGIAQTAITTRSAGETQLRVPTADGVREAQNRRAEIVLPPS